MKLVSLLYIMSIQPAVSQFLTWYSLLFILGIVTLAFTIMLRASLTFLGQLLLLIGSVLLSSFTIYFLFIMIQILLTLYTLYRIKVAIDYNYTIVLEKTHLAPKKITSDGYSGSKFTF